MNLTTRVPAVLLLALVGACGGSSKPDASSSITDASSVSDHDAGASDAACAGEGTLVIANQAGEGITFAVSHGGQPLPGITVGSGGIVTTAEPVGTITLVGTGAVTGNTILTVTPAILCAQPTDIAVAAEPTYALGVSMTGSGQGSVRSSAGAILCVSGSTQSCSDSYLPNQNVTLTAAAQAGSQFSGWAGACTGSAPTCVVDVTQAESVSAQFDPLAYSLLVVLDGNGQGTVTSSPGAIYCSDAPGGATACSSTSSAPVTLTATPATGSTFVGWNGFCIGQQGNTCQVSVMQATTVSATFALVPEQLAVTLGGAGTGLVYGGTPSPAGTAYPVYCASQGDALPMNQPRSCALGASYGTQVTLTAQPDANMTFTGWGGACSGNNTTCTITLNQAQNVTAAFDPTPYALQVTPSGTGQGTVTSLPAGLACTSGSTDGCGANFDYGSSVTLTAAPTAGYVFTSWTSGPCSGSSATTCTFEMTAPTNVTAQFDQRFQLKVTLAGTTYSPPPFTLENSTVSISVRGSSTSVTCDASGANCTQTYIAGTQLQLTANTPQYGGQQFQGWTGCTVDLGFMCWVTMSQATNVTATFGNISTVSSWVDEPIATNGGNNVLMSWSGTSYTCAGTLQSPCSIQVAIGTVVTMTAHASSGFAFSSWQGNDCNGSTSPTCTVTAPMGSTYDAAQFILSH